MKIRSRILALILALVMVFTGSIPANAADISGNDYEFEEVVETPKDIEVYEEEPEEVLPEEIVTEDVSEGEAEEEVILEVAGAGNYPIDCSDYVIQLGGLDVADIESYECPAENFASYDGDANQYFGYPETVEEAIYQAIDSRDHVLDLTPYQIRYDDGVEEYLAGIIAEVINDNPGFFYNKGINSFDVNEDGFISAIYFVYTNEFDEDAYAKALNEAYSEAVTDKSAPKIIIALQLHDWMCQHVKYDFSYSRYSAYDALVDRTAVCQGYTLAYEALLNIAGIGNDYCRSSSMNHIWNYVQIDGKWYQVDTTWDDPYSGKHHDTLGRSEHTYFLVSDSQMSSRNHYGWTSLHSCSDAKYGNTWWTNVDGQIVYKDGYCYYQDSDGSILKRQYSTGTTTTLAENNFVWKVWGTSGGWWGGTHSFLSRSGNYLYYNGPDAIYRMNLSTGTQEKIYTYSCEKGYIYGFLACGSTMSFVVATDYTLNDQKKYSGPISGATIYKGAIAASTKTLTYGSTTKAKLTASAKAAFDSTASNFTYSWYMDDSSTPISGATSSVYYVDPASLDAGTHTYGVIISNEKGHSTTATVTITVKKAATKIESNTEHPYATVYTYNGSQISAPVAANFTVTGSTEAPEFSWYTSSKLTESTKLTSRPLNAGTYYLKVNVPGNTNYDTKYISVKVTVNKVPLRIQIKNQTIYWGEKPVSTPEMVETEGLVAGDTLEGISLTASTTALTTKGTIKPGVLSELSIQNEAGNEVKSSYSITYVNGHLNIIKIPMTVTIAGQNIRYGEIIDDGIKKATLSYPDSITSKYVLGGIRFNPSRVIPGEGLIDGDSARIYKAGTSTDISRYCDIVYEPGTLVVSKAVYSETPIEETVKVSAYESVGEVRFNLFDVIGLPEDHGSVNIDGSWDPEDFDILDSSVVTVEPNGDVFWQLREGLTYSDNGKSDELTFTIETEYYETVVYKLKITLARLNTVTLYANGGDIDGEERAEIRVFDNDPIPEIPGVHCMYKKLEGWYTTEQGGVRIDEVTSDMDAYARWTSKYKTAAPVSDIPSQSTVDDGTYLSLTTTTNGARIYYTLATYSQEPEICDENLYTEAIRIEHIDGVDTQYVNAIAVRDCFENSEVIHIAIHTGEDMGDVTEYDSVDYKPGQIWVGTDKGTLYYCTKPITPELRVYDDKKLLTQGKDYTVKFSNNVNAGTAVATITGKGNYSSTAKFYFTINPIPVDTLTKEEALYMNYTGKALTPKPVIKNGTLTLKVGKDYSLTYFDADNNEIRKIVDAGSYKVIAELKGNYSGTIEYVLQVKDARVLMANAKVTGVTNKAWTGSEITFPDLKVKLDGKELVKGRDYSVSYENNKEIGTAAVVIKGLKNESEPGIYADGYKRVTFKITGVSLADAKITYNDAPYYTNTSYTSVNPDFTIKCKNVVLVAGTDYTYRVSDNYLPGNMVIKITGMNGYSGTKTFKVKLNAISISRASVTGITSPVVYMGDNMEQYAMKVNVGGETLVKGTDYDVVYSNNSKIGTASILIKGRGRYTGSIKKTFKITPYNLMSGVGHTVAVSMDKKVPYNKGGAKPAVSVYWDSKLLTAGKDYTLSYTNNTKLTDGTKLPTVTITGKGNFTGKLTRSFQIVPADISTATVNAPDRVYQAKSEAWKTTVTLKDVNGKALKAGTDYEKTITYTLGQDTMGTRYIGTGDDIDVMCFDGEEVPTNMTLPAGALVRVTVKGKGYYTGTVSYTYRIISASIAKATVKVKAQTYTGKAVVPAKGDITVKIGKTELTAADYDIISVTNNTRKGTATMVIRGKGNYSGTKTVKFTIGARKLWW